MNAKLIMIMILLCSISVVLAQSAITVTNTGYGANGELYLNIRNTGTTAINKVEIYVDGELFRTVDGIIMEPNTGFQEVLVLNEGNHVVKVKTSDGASGEVNIIAPAASTQKPENKNFLEENKTVLSLAIIVVMLVVILLLVKYRPKI